MEIYKVEKLDMQGYMFPDASDKVAGVDEQLLHIVSEVIEVSNAASYEETLIEIYDIIHSCESLLRYIGATSYERERAQIEVVSKNAKRGYYRPSD